MNKANTDIATLGKLVTLGRAPLSATWQSRDVGAGSDWELIALLTYDAASFDDVLATLPPTPQRDNDAGFRPVEWLDGGALPGLSTLPGGTLVVTTGVRDATAFTSSPLTDGFAVAYPESRMVLLYLHTS